MISDKIKEENEKLREALVALGKRETTWDPSLTLAAMKKRVICEALIYFNGNKMRAAAALGISPRMIRSKLKEWGND